MGIIGGLVAVILFVVVVLAVWWFVSITVDSLEDMIDEAASKGS